MNDFDLTDDDATIPPPLYADSAALGAAREVARWHIGDADWADQLIHAYLNPKRALALLRKEKAES